MVGHAVGVRQTRFPVPTSRTASAATVHPSLVAVLRSVRAGYTQLPDWCATVDPALNVIQPVEVTVGPLAVTVGAACSNPSIWVSVHALNCAQIANRNTLRATSIYARFSSVLNSIVALYCRTLCFSERCTGAIRHPGWHDTFVALAASICGANRIASRSRQCTQEIRRYDA